MHRDSDVTDASKLQGEDGDTKDSYSVFASFGAKFSGGVTGTEAKASGGLAQFFATGIAAQKLADNPGIETPSRSTILDRPGRKPKLSRRSGNSVTRR